MIWLFHVGLHDHVVAGNATKYSINTPRYKLHVTVMTYITALSEQSGDVLLGLDCLSWGSEQRRP